MNTRIYLRASTKEQDADLAKHHYDGALNISTQTDDKTLSIQADMAIGKLHLATGDFTLAKSYTQKTLETAEDIGRKPLIYEAHKNLSDIHKNANNYKQSLFHIKQHYQLKEEKFEQSRLEKISLLEEQYKAAQRSAEIKQLKSEKQVEALKNKQKQTYAFTVFGVLLFIGGSAFYLQKKKTLLAANREEMMADLMDKKINYSQMSLMRLAPLLRY
jgi:tetratricopeptide (TPR) repeat protein